MFSCGAPNPIPCTPFMREPTPHTDLATPAKGLRPSCTLSYRFLSAYRGCLNEEDNARQKEG